MPTRSTLLRGRPKESAWTIDGGVMLVLVLVVVVVVVVVGIAVVR